MLSVHVQTYKFMGDHSELVDMPVTVKEEDVDTLFEIISKAKKKEGLPMMLLPTDKIIIQVCVE